MSFSISIWQRSSVAIAIALSQEWRGGSRGVSLHLEVPAVTLAATIVVGAGAGELALVHGAGILHAVVENGDAFLTSMLAGAACGGDAIGDVLGRVGGLVEGAVLVALDLASEVGACAPGVGGRVTGVGEATGRGLTSRACNAGLKVVVLDVRGVLNSVAGAKVVSDRAVRQGTGREADLQTFLLLCRRLSRRFGAQCNTELVLLGGDGGESVPPVMAVVGMHWVSVSRSSHAVRACAAAAPVAAVQDGVCTVVTLQCRSIHVTVSVVIFTIAANVRIVHVAARGIVGITGGARDGTAVVTG